MLNAPDLARVRTELGGLSRPSIRLLASGTSEEPAVGTSKLGGLPDLPPGFDWPSVSIPMPEPTQGFLAAHPDHPRLPPNGIVPLAFVAQINLNELCEFDLRSQLPGTGFLYFFFNPLTFPSDGGPRITVRNNLTGYGYDWFGYDLPKNWQVIHVVGDRETLERRQFPSTLPNNLRYRPASLQFRVEQCLPQVETCHLPGPEMREGSVCLSRDEWDAYCDSRYDLRANIELHQMLGYADQHASTTDEASYRRQRSTLFPELPEWESLSKADQNRELRNIRLLLQLDVFDRFAHGWGRNGRLYFFIRASDLADRDFDKVWGDVE